jgi:hypothetical protein
MFSIFSVENLKDELSVFLEASIYFIIFSQILSFFTFDFFFVLMAFRLLSLLKDRQQEREEKNQCAWTASLIL